MSDEQTQLMPQPQPTTTQGPPGPQGPEGPPGPQGPACACSEEAMHDYIRGLYQGLEFLAHQLGVSRDELHERMSR